MDVEWLPSEGPPFPARFECQTIFPARGETRIHPSTIGFTRPHHSQGLGKAQGLRADERG